MPLTASSVEQLVCVDTCTDADTEECARVLHVDYGVKCEGFEFAQGVAIATLVAFTMVIPGYLLKRARTESRVRVESLALDVKTMNDLFDELDADGSGSLEGDEIKQLVKKMYQGSTSKKLVKATIAELKSAAVATPGPGHESEVVSKAQFQEWFRAKCSGCFETPLDVLFGTTTAKAYWWWFQVLWLKTAINMLYAFGQASRLQWHLWMHLVLGASVCVMINVTPYNSLVDQQVELVALLCLAAVAHITSVYDACPDCGEGDIYLGLAVALAAVPLVVLAIMKMQLKMQLKKEAALMAAEKGVRSQPCFCQSIPRAQARAQAHPSAASVTGGLRCAGCAPTAGAGSGAARPPSLTPARQQVQAVAKPKKRCCGRKKNQTEAVRFAPQRHLRMLAGRAPFGPLSCVWLEGGGY
jgi:hypothetical protein